MSDVDLKLDTARSQQVPYIQGHKRVPYERVAIYECGSCRTKPGMYHVLGCPSETCPICGLIGFNCGCNHD